MKFKIHSQNTFSFLLLIISIIIIGLSLLVLFSEPVNITQPNSEVKIPRGASVWEIARILKTKQIISNQNSFVFLTKLKFSQTKLKSGFYDVKGIKTTNQLINLFVKGQNLSTKVTIPEGSTIKDITKIIAAHINIDQQKFLALSIDSAFIQKLGLNTRSLEGYLFPDTYFFYKNDVEQTVLRKMVENFTLKWQHITSFIPNNAGKNQHEILTLASLIEGECILDEERPTVSSLYQNRLQQGMKLESDPTIQYIINDGPRRLLNNDLKIDSPYNTYMYPGLPPGPVNNPGKKSIIAAIMPEDTNYLYMVAQGDGSHFFTRNYNSFLQAKNRFQKIRKKYKEMN